MVAHDILRHTLLEAGDASVAGGANVVGDLHRGRCRGAQLEVELNVSGSSGRRVHQSVGVKGWGQSNWVDSAIVASELQRQELGSLPHEVEGIHSLLHAILRFHGDLENIVTGVKRGLDLLSAKVCRRSIHHNGNESIRILWNRGQNHFIDRDIKSDVVVKHRCVEEGRVEHGVGSGIQDADVAQSRLCALEPNGDEGVGSGSLSILSSDNHIDEVLANSQRNALGGAVQFNLHASHGDRSDVFVGWEGSHVQAIRLLDDRGHIDKGAWVKGWVHDAIRDLQLLQARVWPNVEEETVVWGEWQAVKDLWDGSLRQWHAVKWNGSQVIKGIELVKHELLHGIVIAGGHAVVKVKGLVLEGGHAALGLRLNQVPGNSHPVVEVDLISVQAKGEGNRVRGEVLSVQTDLDVHDTNLSPWSLTDHRWAVVRDDVLSAHVDGPELAQGRNSGQSNLKGGGHWGLVQPDIHRGTAHVRSKTWQNVVNANVIVVVKGRPALGVSDPVK